jgi:hypothetical protein
MAWAGPAAEYPAAEANSDVKTYPGPGLSGRGEFFRTCRRPHGQVSATRYGQVG